MYVYTSSHFFLHIFSKHSLVRWIFLSTEFVLFMYDFIFKFNLICKVLTNMYQFRSVHFLDRLGRWGDMRHDLAELLFISLLQETFVSSSGMGRYIHYWSCPSSISSADHGIAHPLRCPEGWVWRGRRGMWHARTIQVAVSWQLQEEVPVDPQGSWSCSTSSCWSCATYYLRWAGAILAQGCF